MNTVVKIFLSMSFSGSILILAFLLGKKLLKNKISRQWQYYIWLIVILRLLFPFGPKSNLTEKAYWSVDKIVSAFMAEQQDLHGAPDDFRDFGADREQDNSTIIFKANDMETGNAAAVNVADTINRNRPLSDIVLFMFSHIWVVWLAVSAGMLIRKITAYQSLLQYINAGLTPVSNVEMLERFYVVVRQAGINKPIELCVNPLVSSPMLTGFFYPRIILPGEDISEKDFWYTLLHELTHYKRRDILYKWLVQITVCLHWFNPLVHFMSREIARACEFSCDEAVLIKTGTDCTQEYGKTLLDAMAAVGKFKASCGGVTLSENGQLLKERLEAIMGFKKKSKGIIVLTGLLTVCIILGAFFIGGYSAEAAEVPPAEEERAVSVPDKSRKEIEKYYKAGSLPLFGIEFSRMDEEAQSAWLSRIYEEGEIAFFSVSVSRLKTDSALIELFAERTYADSSISFFSVLADCMGKEMLGRWLDRALEDKKTGFQSVLFDRLDREDEWDALEEEWEAQQIEEYRQQGIIIEGGKHKTYYYKEQMVNVFLDIRENKSFYTLNIDPEGTVNIKVSRNEDGEIISVDYMTEEEVTELLN